MPIVSNYIAGRWVDGSSSIENRNPSDISDLIGHYAQASTGQLHEAAAEARRAQMKWAGAGLEARAAVLDNIGRELMSRSRELGTILSREEGKPLVEGVGEVYRSGQFFTYFAGEILRTFGRAIDSTRPGIEVLMTREPLGVIGVISPWNFPMATASWKIAPALAFGNAVIWKPANLTPASAWALTDIISRQAIPAGLFSLCMGAGGTLGNAFAAEADIDGISFTGSCEVGAQVAALAAPRLIKLQLEMGSKNPLVIMEDADLDRAVAAALNGAFGGTGQKCTASSRLIVHRALHDAFVERFVAAAKAMKVGHALAEDTQMGPVVSETQLTSNLRYVDLARQEGGEIACGGARIDGPAEGYYMQPTVVVRTHNRMRVNQEEMFAPIACVIRVDDFDEAVAVANESRFGLTAGIVTQSLAYATAFRRASKSGCVMVNLPTAGTDYHVSFSGTRSSSYGPPEMGPHAVDFYTRSKTSYVFAGDPQ